MRSFVDLIEEVNTLQDNAERLRQKLEQAEAASKQEDKPNDGSNDEIFAVMSKARLSAMKEHCLTKQDAPVQESYLVLLLMVAKQQMQFIDNKDPLMYPCRIAAALPTVPDMGELWQKALTSNENIIDEYLTVVQDKSLQYSLVFDAVIMALLFSDARTQMLDFVANLASLLAITKQQMQELIIFVKGYMAQDEIVCQAFKYLPEGIVKQCLARYCKKYVVAIENKVIFHWESKENHLATIFNTLFEMYEIDADIPCYVIRNQEINYGSFEEAINDISVGGSFYIKDISWILNKLFKDNQITELEFNCLSFRDEDPLFLQFQDMYNISFKQCKFINCQTLTEDIFYEDYHGVYLFGIAQMHNCTNITFDSCWFENNRVGHFANHNNRTPLTPVCGSYETLTFKDCKAPDGEVKDNKIPTKE